MPGLPDADSSGEILEAPGRSGQERQPPRFDAANTTCGHLLPGGSLGPKGGQTRTITPADRTDYLRAAACMRSNGFPNFPDPMFQDSSVTADIPSSIDQNSSKFDRAAATCTKLIPAGLPYGRP